MARWNRYPTWLILFGVLFVPLALVTPTALAAEIQRCSQTRGPIGI